MMMKPDPSLTVAVLVERLRNPSVWEQWRFRIADVLIDDGRFGTTRRLLRDDGHTSLMLHTGFTVTLFRDEAEGYYLNVTSGAPVWFVMWRIDDDDPSLTLPEVVTLSYNEAGRLLDAQERVDSVPLPVEVVAWLRDFTAEHYRPEPKQRRRPASFTAPSERKPQ